MICRHLMEDSIQQLFVHLLFTSSNHVALSLCVSMFASVLNNSQRKIFAVHQASHCLGWLKCIAKFCDLFWCVHAQMEH